MNIEKGLIRTLKSSTETNVRTEIGPYHPLIPWIIEHAAQLKNRPMVGVDGRTPTERLRGRGVQRLVYELGEKVLFLPLTDQETLAQGLTMGCTWAADHSVARRTFGTPSGVIRCRTLRQLSAQERWDTEFVLSIKGTPWFPDGERAGDFNIRVDLPEAGGDRGAHPPDIDPLIPSRMRFTRCSSGLVSLPNVWVAVPFERELGNPANHTAMSRKD